MRSIRNIAFSALLTIGAFTAITYTACNKDECKDVVCNNGGTCVNGTCSCPIGFEGTNCEVLSRTKFEGKWGGTDQCTSGPYVIDLLTIDKSSSSQIMAVVTNPGGFGTQYTINGTITASNTLSFTNAAVGTRTLNGTMTVTGNAMEFKYSVVDASNTTDNCTGTYARK